MDRVGNFRLYIPWLVVVVAGRPPLIGTTANSKSKDWKQTEKRFWTAVAGLPFEKIYSTGIKPTKLQKEEADHSWGGTGVCLLCSD